MVTPASSGSTLGESRRGALLAVKLKALVRDHLGRDPFSDPFSDVDNGDLPPAPAFGRGAALVIDDTAWVLLDEQPQRGLGPALAWVSRHPDLRAVAILADAGTGVLVRRAPLFAMPISVWRVVGRSLVAAVPDGYPVPVPVDVRHEPWRSVIEEGGAEPFDEHGVLAGEIRGLEVCRVVTDSFSGEVRLEVGVGTHDRQSFMMLHGDRPTVAALAGVVETVGGHRRIDAPLHPLNRLAAERFLRWQVTNAPERVGAKYLRPADPPLPRLNLKDPVPCVAVGETVSGSPLVVVCSVGIDLDLVAFAVDARQMHSPEASLLLIVPERDASPVTLRVAEMAVRPVTVVTWV